MKTLNFFSTFAKLAYYPKKRATKNPSFPLETCLQTHLILEFNYHKGLFSIISIF